MPVMKGFLVGCLEGALGALVGKREGRLEPPKRETSFISGGGAGGAGSGFNFLFFLVCLTPGKELLLPGASASKPPEISASSRLLLAKHVN